MTDLIKKLKFFRKLNEKTINVFFSPKSLSQLDLTTVSKRRHIDYKIQVFKIFHSKDKMEMDSNFSIQQNQTRGNCIKYNKFHSAYAS